MLKTETGYKRMFFLAALYNLVLGFISLVFHTSMAAVFDVPASMREPDVFSQMGILLAMVYGVGYYMVSRDLYAHKGIVLMGIIGKVIVFLLFLYHLAFSGLPAQIFAIGVGDLIFAALFCKFLIFAQDRRQSASI